MKGLEAITNLIPRFYDDLPNVSPKEYVRLEKVRGELLGIVEKELKALEIIKIKKVNIFSLYTSFRTNELWGYNNGTIVREHKLTQQEYDLLKEVLL